MTRVTFTVVAMSIISMFAPTLKAQSSKPADKPSDKPPAAKPEVPQGQPINPEASQKLVPQVIARSFATDQASGLPVDNEFRFEMTPEVTALLPNELKGKVAADPKAAIVEQWHFRAEKRPTAPSEKNWVVVTRASAVVFKDGDKTVAHTFAASEVHCSREVFLRYWKDQTVFSFVEEPPYDKKPLFHECTFADAEVPGYSGRWKFKGATKNHYEAGNRIVWILVPPKA